MNPIVILEYQKINNFFVTMQEELEAAKKFLYYEMGYKARSEQLTDRSEINLSPSDVDR